MNKCYCGLELFCYSDTTLGKFIEKCPRTKYVYQKNKEKKPVLSKAVKEPCDFYREKIIHPKPEIPVDLDLSFLKLSINEFNEKLGKILEIPNINRNVILKFLIENERELTKPYIEKAKQKIQKIDRQLLDILNGYLVNMVKFPNYSHIYNIIHFFREYTLTPNEYLCDILTKIYGKNGIQEIKNFYYWARGFYEYLKINGFCYVPPKIEKKEVVLETKKQPQVPTKKRFKIPPLVLSKQNEESLFETESDEEEMVELEKSNCDNDDEDANVKDDKTDDESSSDEEVSNYDDSSDEDEDKEDEEDFKDDE